MEWSGDPRGRPQSVYLVGAGAVWSGVGTLVVARVACTLRNSFQRQRVSTNGSETQKSKPAFAFSKRQENRISLRNLLLEVIL